MEETIEEAANNFFNNTKFRNYKTFFCEGAKWQQERSYSEEDINKLISIVNWYDNYSDVCPDSETYMWFKQFKKK